MANSEVHALTAITVLRTTLKVLVEKGVLSSADMNTIVENAKESLRTTPSMRGVPRTMSAIEQFRDLAKHAPSDGKE